MRIIMIKSSHPFVWWLLPSSCAIFCLWLTEALFHTASSTRLPNLEQAILTYWPWGNNGERIQTFTLTAHIVSLTAVVQDWTHTSSLLRIFPLPLSLDVVMRACRTWLPAGSEASVSRSAGVRVRRLLRSSERSLNLASAWTSREPW